MELFTCHCGENTWHIYGGTHIKCSACDTDFDLTIPTMSATDFNNERELLGNVPCKSDSGEDGDQDGEQFA